MHEILKKENECCLVCAGGKCFFSVDFPLIVLFIFPFFNRYRGFWINGFLENEFVSRWERDVSPYQKDFVIFCHGKAFFVIPNDSKSLKNFKNDPKMEAPGPFKFQAIGERRFCGPQVPSKHEKLKSTESSVR